ncbi:hypothetical protein BDY24DRAFT_283837 [Mrakia frigida]|uniref:Dcp1p n=1 Tax=Mrakia frigida TaxID=29902 RepID=UPI003FCC0378
MPVTAQTHAMNLKVLQRHDPSILSIVDSATYVVLYHYDEKEGGWKKEGIEGSMFIFRRSISPPLGLFILNRHGLKNWTRPITFNTEFDIQGKTLMLNEQGAQEDTEDAKISGLWVHDVAEGEKLLELLSSFVLVSP